MRFLLRAGFSGGSNGVTCAADGSSVGTPLASRASMPRLAEEEEQMLGGSAAPANAARRSVPPTLPPPPLIMTPETQKRRHIIASLVHSENNYVASLQRLVNVSTRIHFTVDSSTIHNPFSVQDYKRPLEDSNPPILSSSKVQVLFHRVPEILQCHLVFRIALADAIKNWDVEEKIGDVFVASFSKVGISGDSSCSTKFSCIIEQRIQITEFKLLIFLAGGCFGAVLGFYQQFYFGDGLRQARVKAQIRPL